MRSPCARYTRFITLTAFIVATFGLLFPAFAATPYQWKNVQIHGGGFVSGILYHPTEPGLAYARTDVGGTIRWNPAARRWVPLNDDLGRDDSQLTGVVSFAVDPNNADLLYLACGQYLPFWGRLGAMLRSSDRGATWNRTELPIRLGGNSDGRNTGERLQVDPNDGRVLFLGSSQDGLWKSTDSGVTWNNVATFPAAASAPTFVLIDRRSGSAGSPSQTIYVGVATTTNPGLYRTTNGGGTWAPVPGQPAGLMPHRADLAADTNGTLYLTYCNALGPNGVTAGAVWKLDTTTGAWTNITPTPAGQGGYAGISVDASNPARVLLTTLDRWSPQDAIFLSLNGGASWTNLRTNAVIDNSAAPWSVIRTPHWIGDIKLDPHDPEGAMFVTGYGVFACDNLSQGDTGQSTRWAFQNAGLEETVPLAVVSPTVGAPLISALGDQGGFMHHDLDASPPLADLFPTHRASSTSLDFAWNNPGVIVRTHYEGTRGTYTLNGGVSWSDFATAPASATSNGPGAIAVSADGARFVWMPNNSGAYYSTNHGATWLPSAGSPGSAGESFFPAADRVNALKFYIYDRPAGRMHVSTNGGASFSAAAIVPQWGNAVRVAPGHEGHLWLPVVDAGLRRSVDSGASVTTVAGVQRAFQLGFGRAAPGSSYPAIYLWGVISGVEGFYRSNDEGATWTRLNDDANRFGWINDMTGDPRTYGRVYLATGGRGILYGDPAPVLQPVVFAPFASGVAGSYTPTVDTDLPVTFSASNLPVWATLNSANGVITGSPADAAGTVRQIDLVASSGGDVIGRSTVNLLVAAAGTGLRVVNLSARAQVGAGDDILIPGFVAAGSGARNLLIRAVGPTLGTLFNVNGSLADPQLTLQQGATVYATNHDWEQSANLGDLVAAMNASTGFGFPAGSKDAALLATLAPGAYTAKTEGVAQGRGVALVEVYDTTPDGGAGGELVNISARAFVGTGDSVLIPGMYFDGGGSRRVLIRAIGPTLGDAPFHVAGVLADPLIELFSGSTVLATNDDWSEASNADEIRSTADAVFAFPLPGGSKDAVLLTTLVQGAYTVKVSGRNGATGVALVELYVVP